MLHLLLYYQFLSIINYNFQLLFISFLKFIKNIKSNNLLIHPLIIYNNLMTIFQHIIHKYNINYQFILIYFLLQIIYINIFMKYFIMIFHLFNSFFLQ